MEAKIYSVNVVARSEALNSFVREIVAEETGSFWDPESVNMHIYRSQSQSGRDAFQMDVITGSFLVNGKPIGKLPHFI
jgi:hypothetical protein